ncbi:MAG: tol-pal system protein YbgF [Pseudorhodobacter sp.]|nr:tol-pal system protein YbgF [Pseudorhodobacter sp.]
MRVWGSKSFRIMGLGVVLAAVLPLSALAQDRAQTLADIRQELVVMNQLMLELRRELSTTSGVGLQLDGSSTLGRVDAFEAALTQLTAKTEALEFRINQIVADGTNRLGDLEFRLVELEGGDLGAIGQTPTLGGGAAVSVPSTPAPEAGASLATNEQADFDRAQAVLASGDFRAAADLFAAFAQTYTGGPLTAQAHYQRGEALSNLGETGNAARAWLDAFSTDMAGPLAPEALLKVGRALGELGQTPEACVTLAEVGNRFPGGQPAADAAASAQALNCF